MPLLPPVTIATLTEALCFVDTPGQLSAEGWAVAAGSARTVGRTCWWEGPAVGRLGWAGNIIVLCET